MLCLARRRLDFFGGYFAVQIRGMLCLARRRREKFWGNYSTNRKKFELFCIIASRRLLKPPPPLVKSQIFGEGGGLSSENILIPENPDLLEKFTTSPVGIVTESAKTLDDSHRLPITRTASVLQLSVTVPVGEGI